MFRKILIIAALVIVLLLVLNLIFSSMVTRSINDGLREIVIEQDDTTSVEISFDETTVNTLSSSFTIDGLRLYNTGNGNETTVGNLAVNLSYRDFFSLILPRPEDEPPVIRRGQLRMSDFEFISGGTGPDYTFDLLMMRIDGNLNELIRAFETGFRIPPNQAQEIEAEVIRFRSSYALRSERTERSLNLPFPEIERFYIQGIYTPADDEFSIYSMDIDLETIEFMAEGALSNISSFALYNTWENNADFEQPMLRFTAGANPVASRLDVGEGGGGIHFDSLNLDYSGPFFEGVQTRDFLFADNAEISFEVENFTLFTPRVFVETYGAVFGFLGIPTDSFFLPGIRSSFKVEDNVAEIRDFALENPFATIELKGKLSLGTGEIGGARWEGASVNITPRTDQSREFIRTISSFFNFRLSQEDDTYIIPLSGTLSDPNLEGISLN